MSWDTVLKILNEACVPYVKAPSSSETGGPSTTPGAVLLVAKEGEVVFHEAFSCRSVLPLRTAANKETVYDIASLTKAIVTTTLAMKLVQSGQLALDRKLSQIFQTFGTLGKESITIRHLLTHSSGYPAYVPFYKHIEQAERTNKAGIMGSRAALEMVQNEIFRLPIQNLPGKVAVYSDVGFILLGAVIELYSGSKHLEKIAEELIFAPLKLQSTGFVDISKLKRGGLAPVTDVIAPTNQCPWRKRIICGEVQDENAWAMGGIAGHAGLFSTAMDVHRFALEMLRCFHGQSDFVSQDIVREFWQRDLKTPNSTWALGWDTPSPENSTAGKYFSPQAVGHLGFTGCSLWIEPESAIEVILLTNRVHPTAENEKIKELRPRVHNAVMEALNHHTLP